MLNKELQNKLMPNYQEHTGTIIKKHHNILGQYRFVINAGHEKIRVIVGKGIYDECKIGQWLRVGHCGKKLINIRPFQLSEEAGIWNRFIDDIVPRNLVELNGFQRHAVIAFCYEDEISSGGHSGFFNCFEGIITVFDVEQALHEIGADVFVPDFVKAYTIGAFDGYIETDSFFNHINPSLTDLLKKYIIKNSNEIFK